MGKIKLNLDHLQVTSFEATPASQARGTVEAREFFDTASCGGDTMCGRSWCYSGPCCSTTGAM